MTYTEAPFSYTHRFGTEFNAPQVTVRGASAAELLAGIDALLTSGVISRAVQVAADGVQEWHAEKSARQGSGQTFTATVPGDPSRVAQAVASGLDGQVVSSTPTSPAPSTSAPQAPAAPGGVTVEEDRWGGRYEHNLPNAPQTQWGPAVKKTAKAKSGKYYSRWIDPRDKSIPSVYASGVRENPADLWEGEFAR